MYSSSLIDLLIFCRKGVLHVSDGIENIGVPQWPIVLCLFAAWTLTFLALSKGVKSTGKVQTTAKTILNDTLCTLSWLLEKMST